MHTSGKMSMHVGYRSDLDFICIACDLLAAAAEKPARHKKENAKNVRQIRVFPNWVPRAFVS